MWYYFILVSNPSFADTLGLYIPKFPPYMVNSTLNLLEDFKLEKTKFAESDLFHVTFNECWHFTGTTEEPQSNPVTFAARCSISFCSSSTWPILSMWYEGAILISHWQSPPVARWPWLIIQAYRHAQMILFLHT